MFDVRVDTAKNRIYIRLAGFMEDAELDQAAAAVRREGSRLKPGFGVVNDISEFKPASAEGAQKIAAAQKYMAERGMGTVVRIASALSNLQFQRTAKGAGYKGLTASSVTEADALLDAA